MEALPLQDEISTASSSSPVSLMKRIPARETVAGVAFFSELISKTIRIASLSGTRSLETRVRTCHMSAREERRTDIRYRVALKTKVRTRYTGVRKAKEINEVRGVLQECYYVLPSDSVQ